ncbi:MAG: twin-arginine translocase subunit TatC [Chloroflexi bacterium]|nr:twin-arginine translocase subunit TatC [Chloroflexota bacterium]
MKELRKRLMYAFIALVITTGLSMFFAERGLQLIIRPMGDQIPQAINVTESFVVYFRVALILGVALAMPIITYQIIAFMLPGLLPEERKYLYFLVPGVFICFILGVLFAGFIMLPAAINFMQGFLTSIVENKWTLENYVSFVTRVMFWMGITFQLPLVLFFLAKLGIVDAKMLGRFRKWAVLLTAVIAAMITPTPDPVNMMIVMVPLYVLFEVGVLLTRLARRKPPEEAGA